ncbi:S-formylglutathione hydrolase FrmB [Actinoallomurus bryophytorum]|uniref:S-formylglutathione hydrolase FrmB n=1 Tax=Actinoallomurus bryophytorum TaxID=1490222 RepID=A0A543CPN4_9ACTN|nr:S-formylglutathione hydrolase FrmB [Actinoallomurus bryophytorum]
MVKLTKVMESNVRALCGRFFMRGFASVGVVIIVMAVVSGAAGRALAAVPAATADGARVTGERWLGGREVDLTVSSPALGTTAPVRVLLPRGWSRSATRTWPVVYAYHGGRDTYVSWTRSTDIASLAAEYGVMVVMPDTGYSGWFTDWRNHGAFGPPKWETFHTRELTRLMERDYHASTARAAMGISSSGYGAIKYAARHPGMFRYAVSLSGILHLTQTGIPPLILLEASERYDPFRIWGDPTLDRANWEANDPYVQAPHLRGTGMYIASGLTGRPGPYDHPAPGNDGIEAQEILCGATTVSFVKRLKRLGIPATTHIYGDGYHDWTTWQPELHRAWPLMMAAVGAVRTSAAQTT